MGQFIGTYKPDGYNTEEELEMFKKEEEARDFASFLEEHKDGEMEFECCACKRRKEYPLRGAKLALDTLSAKKKREELKGRALIEILKEKPGFPWMIKHDFLESDEPLGLFPQYALFEIQDGHAEKQISEWFFRIEHLVHWGKAAVQLYDTIYEVEAWMATHFGESIVLAHDGELAMSRFTSEIRKNVKMNRLQGAKDLLNVLLYMRYATAKAMGSLLYEWAERLDHSMVAANHIDDAAAYINTHRREKLDVKANIKTP